MEEKDFKEEEERSIPTKEMSSGDEVSATPPEGYVYQWDYASQLAFEEGQKRRKQKRGAWVYAIVMTVAFLTCFAMLAGVLVWYQAAGRGNDGEQGFSTEQVAKIVNPATVLVYCTNSESYGYGTGFFLRSDGYIATNYHVVEGYTNISVTLYSAEIFQAEVVGYSAADDLAVLKIEGSNYPVATIGDSDSLRVGQRAIAVGHPSGANGSWSTTQGIISALNRKITLNESASVEELTMIQTDAPVNPGNSGGPLCNERAEVIGVVTRKMSDYEGIGLAIPINGAMEILNAIIQDGNADNVNSSISKVRPTIGITGGTIAEGEKYTYGGKQYTAECNGVIVSTVEPSGGAYGVLLPCDIIVEFDGKATPDMETLVDLLYQKKAGDKVTIKVMRDGEPVEVSVVLGKAGK